MIVVAIIALLAAIAIPNVLRGRTSANESAAIGNIRALVSSLEMYRATTQCYPALANYRTDMYPAAPVPAFGPPSFNLALGVAAPGPIVQGYSYAYAAGPVGCVDAAAGPPVVPCSCTGWSLDVRPQVPNQTGTRAFFANQNGTISHVTGGGPATQTCPTIDQAPGAAGC